MIKFYAAPLGQDDNGSSDRPERRRTVRHAFGGVAEVTEIASGNYALSVVTELSSGTCFIKADSPLPVGSNVNVRITHNRISLVIAGSVTASRPFQGMAIAFESLSAMDQATLDAWLVAAALKPAR